MIVELLQINFFFDFFPRTAGAFFMVFGVFIMLITLSLFLLPLFLYEREIPSNVSVFYGILTSIALSLILLPMLRNNYHTFSIYLIGLVRWIEGVTAVIVFFHIRDYFVNKSSQSSIKRLMKRRIIYQLIVLLVVILSIWTAGVLLRNGYYMGYKNPGLGYTVLFYWTVITAATSTVGISWKLRHIYDKTLITSVVGFVCLQLGAEIYNFVNFSGDVFVLAIGIVSYISGYTYSCYKLIKTTSEEIV